MPCATRGNHTRPDVYGILSGECRCLCAARLTVATVVRRARGSRVENVSARGRPTRHQRRPRAFAPAPRSPPLSVREAWAVLGDPNGASAPSRSATPTVSSSSFSTGTPRRRVTPQRPGTVMLPGVFGWFRLRPYQVAAVARGSLNGGRRRGRGVRRALLRGIGEDAGHYFLSDHA